MHNTSMNRRTFIQRALYGTAALAAIPNTATISALTEKQFTIPGLWIADSEPGVALAIKLLAVHSGIADVTVFESKRAAMRRLRAANPKPAFIVTDYLGGEMDGSEFITLARHAAPGTRLILHSAVVGDIERWIEVAGCSAPRPHAIIEKPDAQKLMAVLRQMR